MTALILFVGCNLFSFVCGAIAGFFNAPVNNVVEYAEFDPRPAQVFRDNVIDIKSAM